MKNPKIGARIECPECNEELKVVATFPLDVYFAYDDDWEDDDGSDDDHTY
jgi:hypothetical protein